MNEAEFHLALNMYLIATCDILLRFYNPCRFDGESCFAGASCCQGRVRFKRWDPADRRCFFVDEGGCTFPNLSCRTWFCQVLHDSGTLDPKLVGAMDAIHQIAKDYGLTDGK